MLGGQLAQVDLDAAVQDMDDLGDLPAPNQTKDLRHRISNSS